MKCCGLLPYLLVSFLVCFLFCLKQNFFTKLGQIWDERIPKYRLKYVFIIFLYSKHFSCRVYGQWHWRLNASHKWKMKCQNWETTGNEAGKIRYCKLQIDNTISNGKNQNKFTFYKIKKEMKKSYFLKTRDFPRFNQPSLNNTPILKGKESTLYFFGYFQMPFSIYLTSE